MDYDYREMGKLIRKLRKERGLSQDVLSGLAGIGRSHLAMIENGSKIANVETLYRIADALDMRMSDLFQMYESKKQASL